MVAFDALGPSATGAAGTATSPLSWTHTTAGTNRVLVAWCAFDGAASLLSATATCTKGGVATAMVSMGTIFSGGGTAGYIQGWYIIGPDSGACTVTISWTGSPASTHGGSLSFTAAGQVGTPVLVASAGFTAASGSVSVPGTVNGSIVAAGITCGSDAVSFTAGTQRINAGNVGSGAAGDIDAATFNTTGGTATISWNQTADGYAAIAVEIQAPGAPAPPPGYPVIPPPPGWFPGSDQAATEPDGIPFYQQPLPVTDPGAVIAPPTPQAAGFQAPALPPGWFPGADIAATEPDGIPFYQAPQPVTDPGAVIIPPAADPIGIPDSLPFPPGYFPGSQTVTIDPGGIPFYSQPIPLLPPSLPPGPLVISQILGSGTGQYWADRNGNPRAAFGDTIWPIIYMSGVNGGSTTWQSDIQNFINTRAAQGYTAIECNALGNTPEGNASTIGKTWDGINAFLGSNDPTQGLNVAYWQRLDLLLSYAATKGITVFVNMCMTDDLTSGQGITSTWTNTQFTNYGFAVGSRYKTVENLIWMIGDDYFGNNDTQFSAILTGIRNAGDNRPIGIENYTESTSQRDFQTGATLPWGNTNATHNWTYSYNVAYLAVEEGYKDSRKILVMRGDGYYYDGTAAGDQLQRQHTWWALSSGSRGFFGGIFSGGAGWGTTLTDITSGSYQGSAGSGWISNIVPYFTGLANWHKLVPDTTNAFITNRGTRATPFTSGQGSTPAYSGTTDTYVSGSIEPGGTLAVIYWARGATATITINQAKLVPNYTATWVDPASCATTGTATGSTYTKPGSNNSAGDTDWVLVLQGTGSLAVTPPPGNPDWLPYPPGWFPGADQVTDLPGGIPFYVIPQATDQNAAAGAPPVTVNAGLATGTGAALSTSIEIDAASTALVTGTGAAQSPQSALGSAAGLATGTGTAQSPLAGAGANSGLSTGTGTAQPPVPAIGANNTDGPAPAAGTALTTGTSFTTPLMPPAPVIPLAPGWFPGSDTVTTQPDGIPFYAQPGPADPGAFLTSSGQAGAGLATGQGIAQQPLAAVAANNTDGPAPGTGAAQSPLPAVAANTGLATGTGTAQAPQAAIAVNETLATGTGTAQSPLPAVAANNTDGPAPGTGTAQAPQAAIAVNAGLATGTGAALQAATVLPSPPPTFVPLPVAPMWFPGADAVINQPGGIPFYVQPLPITDPGAVILPVNAPAQLATGTGTAQQPVVAVSVTAGLATATGTSLSPGPSPAVNAGLPSAAGAALQPALTLTSNATAQVATAIGAALQPIAAANVPNVKGYSTGTSIGEGAGMQASVGEAASMAPSVGEAASCKPGVS